VIGWVHPKSSSLPRAKEALQELCRHGEQRSRLHAFSHRLLAFLLRRQIREIPRTIHSHCTRTYSTSWPAPLAAPDPVPRRSRAGGIFWLCSELLPWNVHHQQATPSPSGCFLELCWKHVRRLPLGRSCLIDRCASFIMSAAKSLTRCSTQDIISSGSVLRCCRDPCPYLRLLQPVNQDFFFLSAADAGVRLPRLEAPSESGRVL
jgi:hypothetical protein